MLFQNTDFVNNYPDHVRDNVFDTARTVSFCRVYLTKVISLTVAWAEVGWGFTNPEIQKLSFKI